MVQVEQNLGICIGLSVVGGVLEVLATAILAYPDAQAKEGNRWTDRTLRACLAGNVILQILASLIGNLLAPWYGPVAIVGPTFLSAQLVANMLIYGSLLGLESFTKDMRIGTCVIVTAAILLPVVGPTVLEYDEQVRDLLQTWYSIVLNIVLIAAMIFTAAALLLKVLLPRQFTLLEHHPFWLYATLLTARATSFTINLSYSKVFVLDPSTAALAVSIALKIVSGAVMTGAIVVQSTTVQQNMFVPLNATCIIAVNAVTGIIIWEDWRVVQSWVGYATVFVQLVIGNYLLLGEIDLFGPGNKRYGRTLVLHRIVGRKELCAVTPGNDDLDGSTSHHRYEDAVSTAAALETMMTTTTANNSTAPPQQLHTTPPLQQQQEQYDSATSIPATKTLFNEVNADDDDTTSDGDDGAEEEDDEEEGQHDDGGDLVSLNHNGTTTSHPNVAAAAAAAIVSPDVVEQWMKSTNGAAAKLSRQKSDEDSDGSSSAEQQQQQQQQVQVSLDWMKTQTKDNNKNKEATDGSSSSSPTRTIDDGRSRTTAEVVGVAAGSWISHHHDHHRAASPRPDNETVPAPDNNDETKLDGISYRRGGNNDDDNEPQQPDNDEKELDGISSRRGDNDNDDSEPKQQQPAPAVAKPPPLLRRQASDAALGTSSRSQTENGGGSRIPAAPPPPSGQQHVAINAYSNDGPPPPRPRLPPPLGPLSPAPLLRAHTTGQQQQQQHHVTLRLPPPRPAMVTQRSQSAGVPYHHHHHHHPFEGGADGHHLTERQRRIQVRKMAWGQVLGVDERWLERRASHRQMERILDPSESEHY